MSQPSATPTKTPREEGVFRIIVHGSPPIDSGYRFWTEAPECPIAHDGGKTFDEAVERTKDRIQEWAARRANNGAGSDSVEFVVLEAL